jgi:hypothetical protein
MNRSPDVELVLRDYFADDGSIAPDHVLDVLEERIMRQPQQRAWRVLRRDAHVNSYLKPVLAVAAVVAIAVAGFAISRQPSDSGVGGAVSPAPSSSPVASASPSAASSAAAVFPGWFTPESADNGAGVLTSGSQATRSFRPGFTFTVPAGWVNDVDTAEFYGLFPDTPANEAEFARSGEHAQQIFMGVVDTPGLGICEGVGDTHGSTAAELVDSLVASEGLVTSEPVDVTIGGLSGTRVDAHLDPDWTGSCSGDPESRPTKDDKDFRGRFVFLDIPGGGKLMIIVDSVHAADFEAFVAEAMPIVESFQFDLGPAASPS